MAIITLTTDFGTKDHFTGAVKGALLSEISDAKVVDISHDISPFSILEAAYVIQNAFSSFPVGSIHIIGVDSEISEENKHIVVQLNDHYFICANNGIMSMICDEINPQKIVEVNIHDKISTSFPVLDVFVKVAAHISRGGTLEVIGKLITIIKPIKNISPIIKDERNLLIGNVIYIDHYGNVITNIRKRFFESIQKGRRFEISARNHKFKHIYNNYSDIIDFNIPIESRNNEGQGLVVFNSSGYLEIAIFRSNLTTVGSASTLLGLNMMDTVSISFLKD
jgi:S-adenosylmethionine hydrolase|tara:strand:+ start:1999 stop:2835 length:837 start_codon:yes stop_codon:yes gene_type:complete